MKDFVELWTPIPSLEEVAKNLGISKGRQKALLRIVRAGQPLPRSSSSGAVVKSAKSRSGKQVRKSNLGIPSSKTILD